MDNEVKIDPLCLYDESEEAEEPAEPDDAEEETLPDEENPEEVLEDEEE